MNHRTALLGITAVVLPVSLLGISGASANTTDTRTRGNQLVCFDGASEGSGNGTCRLIPNGAVFVNAAPGDYAGVYVKNDGLQGKTLGAVTQLSFKYNRNVSGGAPRFSLAIDANGDGSYEFFAFADPNGCGIPTGGTGNMVGKVDVINNPNCQITTNDGRSYPNYAAFVAGNPGAKYATNQVSFIIADQPGNYRVVQVKMGRAPAHGA